MRLMDTPEILTDEELGLCNFLRPLIGRFVKTISYIIPNETLMPNFTACMIHSALDAGEFEVDNGDKYMIQQIFSWDGTAFHSLVLKPSDHFSLNDRFSQTVTKSMVKLNMTPLESWSPYIGLKIIEIVVGWGYNLWFRNNEEYKSPYWIRLFFEDSRQLLITQGTQMWRLPDAVLEVDPQYFKIGEIKPPGVPIIFSFQPEDFSIIFDEKMADIIIEHWSKQPYVKGGITKITEIGCEDGFIA